MPNSEKESKGLAATNIMDCFCVNPDDFACWFGPVMKMDNVYYSFISYIVP